MSDLFWPGDERAGGLLSEAAWLDAMVTVEQAWLDILAKAGLAPATAPLAGLVGPDDLRDLAGSAEAGGNPVIGLVGLLRASADQPAADWIHRGLTSQDVVDTALMLCLRDAVRRVLAELRAQAVSLADLAATHRDAVMAGRTLTQHAVPITFGVKVAGWLGGVLDAAEQLDGLALPAQIGGAAGTLAAIVELAPSHDPAVAAALAAQAAERLGLAAAAPWHTARAPLTRIGDALAGCCDVLGKIAGDVALLSRPEIAELAEPTGGGSSTMPHKRNPVLAILVRRAALTAPQLAATLHLASVLAADERPDGAWHAEWATLRDLGRRTVVAASQAAELLAGLHVDTGRMAATAQADWADLTAERAAVADFTGAPPSTDSYLGAAGQLIDAAVSRSHAYLEQHPAR